MLKQYTRESKKNVWSVLKKLTFIIPAGIIIYMFYLDSREVKQQFGRLEQERQEFVKSFDVYVFQSGYLRKSVGFQEIYVPSVALRISNLTDTEYSNLRFSAYFQRDGKSFCRGTAALLRLRPLETKDVYLRCVDSAVFGSVVSGLSLMATTGNIEYVVSISHEGVHATAVQGIIEFNVLL